MSPRSPILIAVLGAALLAPVAALAGPPRAGDPPANPVPAGQMQHTVIETTFPADKNTHALHGFRDERWVGADAGRELITDTTTGETRSDCQVTTGVSRCYAGQIAPGVGPKAGTISIYSGGLGEFLRSWLDESMGVRSLLQQGFYHVTGNTTLLGRPAISIADNGPSPSPDGGTATTSLIVDADTYFTLWREDRNIDMPVVQPPDRTVRKQSVDQIAETKVMELIDPTGVQLTIGSYPGAKVTDERPAAVAKRKAAIKRRAAAKCRKHHHSKKYCPQKKGY
jgi:hypothetical protein